MSLKREFKLLRKTLGRAWRDEKMRGLPRSPPSRKNAGLTKVPTSRKNAHTPVGRKIVSFSGNLAPGPLAISHICRVPKQTPFSRRLTMTTVIGAKVEQIHRVYIETGRQKTGGEFFCQFHPD